MCFQDQVEIDVLCKALSLLPGKILEFTAQNLFSSQPLSLFKRLNNLQNRRSYLSTRTVHIYDMYHDPHTALYEEVSSLKHHGLFLDRGSTGF